MATKYTRVNFRERAHGVVRRLEETKLPRPRRQRMSPFLFMYMGIFAFMGAAILVDRIMARTALELPQEGSGLAVVQEKIHDEASELEPVYFLVLNLTLEDKESRSLHVETDAESWDRVAVGEQLSLDYTYYPRPDKVVIRRIRLAKPEVAPPSAPGEDPEPAP